MFIDISCLRERCELGLNGFLQLRYEVGSFLLIVFIISRAQNSFFEETT
jgi:hypothetical protein